MVSAGCHTAHERISLLTEKLGEQIILRNRPVLDFIFKAMLNRWSMIPNRILKNQHRKRNYYI